MPDSKSRPSGDASQPPAPPVSGRARRESRRNRSEPVAEENSQPSGSESSPPHPVTPERPVGGPFRDFLIPYILLAISMQRAHGYLIEQYLRGLGLVNLEMSTLYRTLRQMEKDGLVSSTWEPGPEGPARRIYTLTSAGRWWLDMAASMLQGYRALIDRFFGSYTGLTRDRVDNHSNSNSEKGSSQ